MYFAATIERAEKQIILARHARTALNLLDDTPIVPGDAHQSFEGHERLRQVLNDAEEDLRNWSSNLEPITSSSGSLGVSAMPSASDAQTVTTERTRSRSISPVRRADTADTASEAPVSTTGATVAG